MFAVKIRNNGCNHLNEILYYAIIIHISMPLNHIHKTQTTIFLLNIWQVTIIKVQTIKGEHLKVGKKNKRL